jgi:uncharacterized peroxidase-related enzyme
MIIPRRRLPPLGCADSRSVPYLANGVESMTAPEEAPEHTERARENRFRPAPQSDSLTPDTHAPRKVEDMKAAKGKAKSASARAKAPAGESKAAASLAAARTPDDVPITALALTAAPLSADMEPYFRKCEEKLGFVPHVLSAYAFDMAKLEAFVAMYNDLMLAPSGLTKLEREMIAVAVSSVNRCYYCLVAHGAAVRQLSGDPLLGEQMVMNYRAARLSKRQRAMLDFAVKLTAQPWMVEEEDREGLRAVGFSDRDIWDVGAVAAFFNMSNRVASATDMRPNAVYHAQAR